MNNKLFKLGLSIGSIGAVAAPIVTVVSCGGRNFAGLDVKTINTGGYSQSMNKLAAEDISIAGAWGDSRFYAATNASNLHVVGVEKKRITNDGIQVRGDMKVSDQIALQNLFKNLIEYSKKSTSQDLRMDFENSKGKMENKSVFNIYSHENYKALKGDDDISLIDPKDPNGALKNSKAGTGTNQITSSSKFSEADSDFFSVATPGANNQTELKNNYSTKSGKTLNIVFIPSNDASKVTAATGKLQTFLTSIGVSTNITVSTDYDSAASSLEAGQIDIAFLPAETWSKSAPSSKFIIQASRPVQIATINVTGNAASLPSNSFANEKDAVTLFNKYGQLYLKDVTTSALALSTLKANQTAFKQVASTVGTSEAKIKALADATTGDDLLAGSYEAWLYTKKDSGLDNVLKDKHKTPNWTMPYEDVKDKVIYGYTSTTSSASYLFPELWFNEHFTK